MRISDGYNFGIILVSGFWREMFLVGSRENMRLLNGIIMGHRIGEF